MSVERELIIIIVVLVILFHVSNCYVCFLPFQSVLFFLILRFFLDLPHTTISPPFAISSILLNDDTKGQYLSDCINYLIFFSERCDSSNTSCSHLVPSSPCQDVSHFVVHDVWESFCLVLFRNDWR